MEFFYDVIVIGAGHAGCEAAAAAANMGSKTCLITMDMNKIGQMSCNPAIGGIAKGQIVREIDALGGFTGIVTDRTAIQFRMLNRSKGPAMWSPRAQCDREKFIWAWREILDNTPNLRIWQDTVSELLVENGEVTGVRTVWGVTFHAKCVVVTAGTFLNGLLHVGHSLRQSLGVRRPGQNNLGTGGLLVLLNGNQVGKTLQRVYRCALHKEHGLTRVLDKLIENLLVVVVLAALELRERAHTDNIAIARHHGNSLEQVFALVAIHNHTALGFEFPRALVHIQHDDIHTEVHRRLLGAQTGAKAIVEEDEQGGLVATQLTVFVSVCFDFERLAQSLFQVAEVGHILEYFHIGYYFTLML